MRRRAAVMFEDGLSPVEVAAELEVSAKSARAWRRARVPGGVEALASRGRPDRAQSSTAPDRQAGSRFSFAIARDPAVDAAIAAIGDDQYTPVRYPGAVIDPDTGELISDAQVAEAPFAALIRDSQYSITGRLIIRRVLDAAVDQDPLFPVWRYHSLFTNNTEPATDADLTHRQHAVCETVCPT